MLYILSISIALFIRRFFYPPSERTPLDYLAVVFIGLGFCAIIHLST